MTKASLFLLTNFLWFGLPAQPLKLNQQKLKGDFIISSGPYLLYVHKADLLAGLEETSQKLRLDNADTKKQINDGVITRVDLLSVSPSDRKLVELVKSSLGCYILLKSKVALYKNDKKLNEISIDEAPPEVELDGTRRNVFRFAEIGSGNTIFIGSIRSELR